MAQPKGYKTLKGTEHIHPPDHKQLNPTAGAKPVTATLILRRRTDGERMPGLEEFSAMARTERPALGHARFAARHGAASDDIARVQEFARSRGLEVLETNPGARSVVIRGTAAAMNGAFGVELHDYDSPRGKYHSHTGEVSVPGELADSVENVLGLDNRPIPARHYSTARRQNPADPPNTQPLTPQQVAQLYNFPAGDGTGQTIGIYEMQTDAGPAGYTMQDIGDTMNLFGGGLKVPKPINVAVDGVGNSGTPDGETGLDITIASAIAQNATIAVYFTGGDSQSIIHALQRMIHPGANDPFPTVISISYGWGPDDEASGGFTDQEYQQIDQLFQDAANLSITVLVSSGDSGAFIESTTVAQTSFPASDPWVTACGGTTIGNVNGTSFTEYVWNDTGKGGPGSSGGGVSARFPVPAYQANVAVPNRLSSGTPGRGVPDLAGNASENSGYMQVINGQQPQSVGGTSAVAPLYAGLVARINSNLGAPVGFLNPLIYSAEAGVFRPVGGPPGPANNSFSSITGYPAPPAGWNPCTGLGSIDATAFENGIKPSAAAASA